MNIQLEHSEHGTQNVTTQQHYDYLISVGWKEVKKSKKKEISTELPLPFVVTDE